MNQKPIGLDDVANLTSRRLTHEYLREERKADAAESIAVSNEELLAVLEDTRKVTEGMRETEERSARVEIAMLILMILTLVVAIATFAATIAR